jgi:hypothetical protein
MTVQAAMKGVNEEQTASLETALLHGHCGLVLRTQMRTAQRGFHSVHVDIDKSSHQGLVERHREDRDQGVATAPRLKGCGPPAAWPSAQARAH